MKDLLFIEGPVELIDGRLTLRIPLAVGGDRLVRCARGIGRVEGDTLNVIIPDWLARKLGVTHGSLVIVDNQHGKFHISPSCQTRH